MVFGQNIEMSSSFLGQIGQEKVFDCALVRKRGFLDYENIDLKKSKKSCIFPKGLLTGHYLSPGGERRIWGLIS